jgi:hypothetical protein
MAAPERFAEKSDSLLHRGRRPYMAHRYTYRGAKECRLLGEKRKSRRFDYSPKIRRLFSIRISSAMLVGERRTSSANGAFGRHERHDSDGIKLLIAASRCRSSARRSPLVPSHFLTA